MKRQRKDFYKVKSKLNITEKIDKKNDLQPLKMVSWLETKNSVSEMGKVEAFLINLNKNLTLKQIKEDTGIEEIKKDIMKFRKETFIQTLQINPGSEEEVEEEVDFGGKVLIVKDIDVHKQFTQPQYMKRLPTSFIRFCQHNKIDFIVHYLGEEATAMKVQPEKVRVIKKRNNRPEKIEFSNTKIGRQA